MTIYTMGFAKKNAESFFETLKANGVQLLIDVRLNNKSQLAGFTKGNDIQYFLKVIGGIEYLHCVEYAPTKELLSSYQKKEITWAEYVTTYQKIIERRNAHIMFFDRFSDYEKVCLLCSEPTPEQCHRRLFAEMVEAYNPGGVEIKHV